MKRLHWCRGFVMWLVLAYLVFFKRMNMNPATPWKSHMRVKGCREPEQHECLQRRGTRGCFGWCVSGCWLLTSSWLCAGVVVVLVLTSQRVGTVFRLSGLMKGCASAYSDSESAGEENREFVERSSMQDRSWRQRGRERMLCSTSKERATSVAEQRDIPISFQLWRSWILWNDMWIAKTKP